MTAKLHFCIMELGPGKRNRRHEFAGFGFVGLTMASASFLLYLGIRDLVLRFMCFYVIGDRLETCFEDRVVLKFH